MIEFQLEVFSKRERVNYAGDFEVWIISKEGLILSKLNWAKNTRSEMQLRDVASILRNGYDENYVKAWAKEIGVEDLLKECIGMIGIIMLKDTTREIEELQNELWMKKTPQERARFASAMFAAARKTIIASLPKDLSDKEFKKQLYFRTYGEHLPEDFFDKV